MTDKEPIGQAFSRVYLKPIKPLKDSKRFRNRLAAGFGSLGDFPNTNVAGFLKMRYGVQVPIGTYGYLYSDFFELGDLHDVLDAITGVYQCFKSNRPQVAATWATFVKNVFAQETLGYRLDEECGVHLAVDDEFERNRTATIAGLGQTSFSAALLAYNNGMEALDRAPPDTLGAVRGIFDALEEVFKIMFASKVSRLGSTEIEKTLRPKVLGLYQGPANATASKMTSAFADWVDGMHAYRHAAGDGDPAPPPFDLAIMTIGSGSSFLRWLLDLHRIDTK